MLFSRFWILLLAALTGLSIAAMTLARLTYEHDRRDDASALLTSDRQLLDEFLRRDARSRIDDLAPVSSNPQLVTLMEATVRRTDDAPSAIGTAITQRVRELNQGLGPLRGDVMLAVDPRGVVVGRTGIGEGEVGTNLGGLPLVASALAGNVRDDLWEVSGQAYRMAARPVISQGRYYVGAIVHGIALNDRFAENVSQLVPGASVMFFGPEGMYASFQPQADRGARRAPAPAVLVERLRQARARDDWKGRGVTDAMPASDRDGETGVAVFAGVPGMIGAAGGGIALGRPLPVMPTDFLLKASKQDMARVPFVGITLFALFCALMGNALVYIEYDSKRRKLHKAFKALQEAGATHLDPLELGGFAREIAVDANDAIDEVVKREVQRNAGRMRNVNELENLLSAPPDAPRPPVSMPSMPGSMPAPMPAPMPSSMTPPLLGAPPMPPPVLGAPPMPPPSAGRAAPPPPNVRRAMPVQIDDDEQPTHVAPLPASVKTGMNAIGAADPEEQAHWREVYEQFVSTKRECGESTESLTFEKFTSTLQKHKDQLVAKTGSRTVRFQVYVKDSKATLKATPVR